MRQRIALAFALVLIFGLPAGTSAASCGTLAVSSPFTNTEYVPEAKPTGWYGTAHVRASAGNCSAGPVALGVELLYEGTPWGRNYQEGDGSAGPIVTHTGGTYPAYTDLPCNEGNYQGVAAAVNNGIVSGPKYGHLVHLDQSVCPTVYIYPPPT